MNAVARNTWKVLKRSSQGVESVTQLEYHRHEQLIGIWVKAMNGNLEWALTVMQRKMTSRGIERMIKQEQTHHLKNSEKLISACKNLEQKLWSQGHPPQERAYGNETQWRAQFFPHCEQAD
ncbi:hypothetical protein ACFX13_009646 [Malus domestica]